MRSRLADLLTPAVEDVNGQLAEWQCAVASATGVLFGLCPQNSVGTAVAGLTELARELTLAIYLIVKGFKPSPITSANTELIPTAAAAVRA